MNENKELEITQTTSRPQGFILAGGKSQRFGSDKSRARIGQQTLIERIAQPLQEWTAQPICVIADQQDKYADLNLFTVADDFPGQGPLAGIHKALLTVQQNAPESQQWAIIASCDLTRISPEWLEMLWQSSLNHQGSRMICFEEKQDHSERQTLRWHPFPGCYHVSLIEEIISMLEGSHRSCMKLIERLGSTAV
ncbi:MAG: molybdenum cofactor guanylyltransferase, partial [Planctomycetaceae bacterium]|nr:molybdenum cofactor guanylyltransferase [Planctomycetaceae bacterium]